MRIPARANANRTAIVAANRLRKVALREIAEAERDGRGGGIKDVAIFSSAGSCGEIAFKKSSCLLP
jgi:hypothetical protein